MNFDTKMYLEVVFWNIILFCTRTRTEHKVIIIYLNDDASEKNVFPRKRECDTMNNVIPTLKA